jgi:putative ABC transport system permease protein
VSSIRVGLGTLGQNRLRTGLSTLGVIIGVAALVAVLAVGDGVERFARNQIEARTDVQTVAVRANTERTVDGIRVPIADPILFTAVDATALLEQVSSAVSVALVVTGAAFITPHSADEPRALMIVGSVGWGDTGDPTPMAYGRDLSAAELRDTIRLTVASHGLARALTGDRPASLVGTSVRIGEPNWTVVGVRDSVAGDDVLRAEVPFAVASSAMLERDRPRLPTLLVRAKRIEDVESTAAAIDEWLESRYGDPTDRFFVAANRRQVEQLSEGILIFKLLMGAVTGISLVVGGIGIMNVLLASVIERTREIGVRKAAGARNRDILIQFLSESVAICAAGSALGFVVGLATAFGVTALMRSQTAGEVHPSLTWSTFAIAAGVAVMVGVVFGTYPALRAARLSPIDAIRHE